MTGTFWRECGMGRCRYGVWSSHRRSTVGVGLWTMALFMAGLVLGLRGRSTDGSEGSVCYRVERTCAFETVYHILSLVAHGSHSVGE